MMIDLNTLVLPPTRPCADIEQPILKYPMATVEEVTGIMHALVAAAIRDNDCGRAVAFLTYIGTEFGSTERNYLLRRIARQLLVRKLLVKYYEIVNSTALDGVPAAALDCIEFFSATSVHCKFADLDMVKLRDFLRACWSRMGAVEELVKALVNAGEIDFLCAVKCASAIPFVLQSWTFLPKATRLGNKLLEEKRSEEQKASTQQQIVDICREVLNRDYAAKAKAEARYLLELYVLTC